MKKINYDKCSQIYDLSRDVNSNTLLDLVRLTHINSNSLLLDMGCGTGNYTASLNSFAKCAIGIDLSLGMISNARVKFNDLDFINGNIKFLPFKQYIFDGLYLIQVLHHIDNKFIFLKECNHVLKKNGYLAIHTCSHKQIKAVWYYYYFQGGLKMDLKRIPDIKEIVSLLELASYSKIKVHICYEDSVILNQTPENYLDKNYRAGDSTFALLSEEEINTGCEKLKDDINSEVINEIIKEYEKKSKLVGKSTIIYCKKV